MKSLVALSLAVTLGTMAAAYAASPAASSDEAPFLAENQAPPSPPGPPGQPGQPGGNPA